MSKIIKDLGAVTAYAYAVEGGYTGTEEEFAALMADYASVEQRAAQSAQTATEKAQEASASATSASQSASSASASATSASQSATTATAKASEAQQGATTATTKAQEASQSASESAQSAQTAVQAKEDAQTAKTASETAQGIAETARDEAVSARDTAQQYAESIDPEKLIGAYPVDTATGAIASFSDGANDIPMESVKLMIEPVQEGSGDPSPDNVRPITGFTGAEVVRTGKNLLNSNYSAYQINRNYTYMNGVVPEGQTARFTFIDKDTSVDVSGAYIGFQVGLSEQQTNPTEYNWVFSAGQINSNTTNVKNGVICSGVFIYPKTEEAFDAIFSRWDIMVELGLTATEYESYQGQTYPVTFPSEAGTVYGGTLDVTSGELVVDRANITSYNGETLPSTWISDRDMYSAGVTPTIGAQVVYDLAEPIVYTLTPTEIKSLLGDNNVWGDTGDIEVEYRADTTLYINRKIAEAISALT